MEDSLYQLTNTFDESISVRIALHDNKIFVCLCSEEFSGVGFQTVQVFLNPEEARMVAEKMLQFASAVEAVSK